MRKKTIFITVILFLFLVSGGLAVDDIGLLYKSGSTDIETKWYKPNTLPSCSTDKTIPGLRFIGFTNQESIKYAQNIPFDSSETKDYLFNSMTGNTYKKCSDTSFIQVSDGEPDGSTYGVLVGGYLYVLEEINLTIAYQIRDDKKDSFDDCWNGAESDRDPHEKRTSQGAVSLAVYSVDAEGKPLAVKNTPLFSYDGFCAKNNDDIGWSKLTDTADKNTYPLRIYNSVQGTYEKSPKYLPLPTDDANAMTLHPGIYFIYIDLMVESDDNNNGADSKIRINLNDGYFYEEQDGLGTPDLIDHLNRIGEFNRLKKAGKYFIVPSFLSDVDLLRALGDEELQSFCVNAGFDWSEEILPLKNACCGDSLSDDGFIDTTTGWTCVMSGSNLGGEWIPFLDGYYDEETQATIAQGYCSATLKGQSLSYSDVPPNSLLFSSNDGRDGCCGDDEEGDLAYTTSDGTYFCNKDYFNEKISFNTNAQWKWWDASSIGVPFKIHSQLGVDYISNGADWFYCNATGNVPARGGAQSVAVGDTFSSATIDGYLSCVDALNSIYGFIEENTNYNVEPFTVCKDGQTSFCCERTDDKVVGFDYINAGFFAPNNPCRIRCYLQEDELFADFLTVLSPNQEANLTQEYCSIFQKDYACSPSTGNLFNFSLANELVEKSACGLSMSCLTESPALDVNCTQIQLSVDTNQDGVPENQRGVLCGELEPQYCASGNYILSKDVLDTSSKVCCLTPDDALAMQTECRGLSEQPTEQECRAAGGDFIAESLLPHFVCSPTQRVVGSCCLGGRWEAKGIQFDDAAFVQPDAFICYAQSGNNYFSECCNDFSVCQNSLDMSFLSGAPERNKNGYYGKGGVLHTIENFDKFTEDILRDYVFVQRLVPNTPVKIYVKQSNELLNKRQLYNWNTFDYLEFDIAFNINRLEHVVLTDTANKKCTSLKTIPYYLVNGKGTMRWQHAVVPLKNEGFFCEQGFDWTDVKLLELTTAYAGGNLHVAVDNFFLSENNLDDKSNTENYYCAGNFGQWVTNLDGPADTGDQGFAEGATFTQTGPYWYACEAQASFDWTGSRCCGDDTRSFGDSSLGEYYLDSRAACFSGKTVHHDMSVAFALNSKEFADLLYYIDGEGDKGFYRCEGPTGYTDYSTYTIAYSDTEKTDDYLIQDGVKYKKTDFDVVGSHVCLPSGAWVSVDSISKARIIASKMFEIATDEISSTSPHFSIFCDDFSAFTPLDLTSNSANLALGQVQGFIRDSCVLTYSNAANKEADKTLIGLGLRNIDIQLFLESLFEHAMLFDEELLLLEINSEQYNLEREEFITACNSIPPAEERTDFFGVCEYEGYSGLRMAYNPEFNILFLAYTQHGNEFDGIFSSGFSIGSFAQDVLDGLMNWFRSWFSPNKEVFSANAFLPVFSNDSIVFDRFYLHQKGEKIITGLAEDRANTDNIFYTIEYQHINSSVEFLATNYYNNQAFSQNYVYGNPDNLERQMIQLVNPTKKHAYEKPFDWRRLIGGLIINHEIGYTGDSYVTIANDGIIQLGEACDYSEALSFCKQVLVEKTEDDPEKIELDTCMTIQNEANCDGAKSCVWVKEYVYKFNQNSCEFWNYDLKPTHNVTCNEDTQTINFSLCEMKSCAERGLFNTSKNVYRYAILSGDTYNSSEIISSTSDSITTCCSKASDCAHNGACYSSGFTAEFDNRNFSCEEGVWRIQPNEPITNHNDPLYLSFMKGCDVQEGHSYCSSNNLCVTNYPACPCDSFCLIRNEATVECETNFDVCDQDQTCMGDVCCDKDCELDNSTDYVRCANGCTTEPKEYCWNYCELYNNYCNTYDIPPMYDPQDPCYIYGYCDDYSSSPDFCNSPSFQVPDSACEQIYNYGCTEAMCSTSQNGCGWFSLTQDETLNWESSSGGTTGGTGGGGGGSGDTDTEVYHME